MKIDKKLNKGKEFIYEAKEEPNEAKDIEINTKISYKKEIELINYTIIKISTDKNENVGPKIKNEEFFYGKENIEIQRKNLYENGNFEELSKDNKKNKNDSSFYKNYLSFLKEIEENTIKTDLNFNPGIEFELEKQNDSSINALGLKNNDKNT